MTAPLRRAVFLDRDGVLNHDRGDIGRPADFEWRPGVMHALRALKRAGWALVVATNQPGIARGRVGPAEFANLTEWMHSELAHHGIALDAHYHCPHLVDAPLAEWRRQCDCHKPLPGMLRRAARDLALDLSASVILGSHPRDMRAGRAAGVAACIRITDTIDAIDAASRDIDDTPADFTCANLGEATRWLLAHEETRLA